jgi:hypothetical protein
MRAELHASQVEPGSVIELEGRPHRVTGTLRFTSEGRRWGEHCVEGPRPGTHEWISIRPRGSGLAVHWTPRHDLFGEPDPDGVTVDGRRWTLDERGRATYAAAGDTGTGPTGTCEFVEFTAEDARLVFESFDGAVWEISVGRPVELDRVRADRDVSG